MGEGQVMEINFRLRSFLNRVRFFMDFYMIFTVYFIFKPMSVVA